MAGGKATPKKDKALKVSAGQPIKTGQILVRNLNCYDAGRNVKGKSTLVALCAGTVYFTKKKTGMGKVRTLIGILPSKK